MYRRHKTKVVKIGRLYIGGNYPIAIQGMTKTKTKDIDKTIMQIKVLEKLGCEIVRLAIKDKADAFAIKKIKPQTELPLVADIHFDWRLALAAIDNGIDKIRLNPANIYKQKEIEEIVSALKNAKLPLRVGVNSGSVKDLNSQKLSMADKLVKSALNYIKILEKLKFYNIVISLKASSVLETILAYRKIIKICDYPLHLGMTATGLSQEGIIKSSIALGVLLLEGIGDTLRVSLTEKPEVEIKVAKGILSALGLRSFGPEIISCPTCGRCEVDLVKIVEDLEDKLSALDYSNKRPLKIAIMGCVVNGPGEAKEADMGVAFGKKEGLLFKVKKPTRKISKNSCVKELLKEINRSL